MKSALETKLTITMSNLLTTNTKQLTQVMEENSRAMQKAISSALGEDPTQQGKSSLHKSALGLGREEQGPTSSNADK
eukprot:3350447-Ditylum_brightwellii.AAC.1